MVKELKKKRDEARQAWEHATVVMKKAEKADDLPVQKRHTTKPKNFRSST